MQNPTIESGPFEPTWESLRTFACPEWFRDAKLGIWAHWGAPSATMFGDWYGRNMYVEGGGAYRHHWRRYGHPSKFGYKDIVKLWKAERFDPDALLDLYVAAGARYFVAQAVHHDNFDNWNSRHHAWNAVQLGPQKDIVGLWCEATRKRGLPFGVAEHLGSAFRWFVTNKDCDQQGPYAGVPYDGNDPAYEDFYLPNQGETREGFCTAYTGDPWWHERWFDRIKDLIDQYQPDLLYSDGGVPFYTPADGVRCEGVGLHLIAHLYNISARLHKGTNQAVYTQKDQDPDVFAVGVLDIERGMQGEIAAHPWQTDTCVGAWFYSLQKAYKTPQQVIGMLVNIVSKNGNLLLNIGPRPDGTLDEECLYILECLTRWVEINGEGIFATRPWRVAGEGPSMTLESGSYKEDALAWTARDFRFTAKGDAVYAFQMEWPEDGRAIIKSLGGKCGLKVSGVDLLGHDGKVKFEQQDEVLSIQLPAQKVGDYAHCFRVRFV